MHDDEGHDDDDDIDEDEEDEEDEKDAGSRLPERWFLSNFLPCDL